MKDGIGNNQGSLIKAETHGLVLRSLSGGLIGRGLAELPNSPAALPKNWTNDLGMEFVRIDPGIFLMGAPDTDEKAEDDEVALSTDKKGEDGPQHWVRISQPFYLGKYPVTRNQWRAVMENSPSSNLMLDDHPDLVNWASWDDAQGNHPMDDVSWDHAQAFIYELNTKDRGRNYRLPTEAEWEYACRAGTTTRYFFGDDATLLDRFAWYKENSSGQIQPVGRKEPNPWGLYDMLGNVEEWVADLFGGYWRCMESAEYKQSGFITDPLSDGPGEEWEECRERWRKRYDPWALGMTYVHVLRGGAWYESFNAACSTSRTSRRHRAGPFSYFSKDELKRLSDTSWQQREGPFFTGPPNPRRKMGFGFRLAFSKSSPKQMTGL